MMFLATRVICVTFAGSFNGWMCGFPRHSLGANDSKGATQEQSQSQDMI